MTNLYRHFDENGILLYVGVSLSAIKRLSAHATRSPWSNEIKRVDIQSFLTRKEALAAESTAIRDESPRYNKFVPSTDTQTGNTAACRRWRAKNRQRAAAIAKAYRARRKANHD